MKKPIVDATALFCAMRDAWDHVIPKTLAEQNPSLLMKYLWLASRKGGVSRSELQAELGLTQSNGSKLARKLLDEGWLKAFPDPGGDGRREFLQATAAAMTIVKDLEVRLQSTFPATPGKRKDGSIHPLNQIGSFFERKPEVRGDAAGE
jgi:hypothetical protein